MRVIAGSARRLKLKTPAGMDTRPTQDIIKETLFNVIQNDVPGSLFLDIFAGSGQIGIEALSRGARKAIFIENNKKTADLIRENLEFTRLSDRGEVIGSDVMAALSGLENTGFYKSAPFDIIHLDPPYESGLEVNVLSFLRTSALAGSETLIIIEASQKTDFSFAEELGFDIIREKIYKHNRHVFLKRGEQTEGG